MAKRIISIGFAIPGSPIKIHSIRSKVSLLDFDLAIFDPHLSNFYSALSDSYFQGKVRLSDSKSFELKEHLTHWRREISEALTAGINVFVLLNSLEEVYIYTGQITYTGVGKNSQRSKQVALENNYGIIPGGMKVISSIGSAVNVSEESFSNYWSKLESISQYRVLIDASDSRVEPVMTTKSGKRVVGAIIRYQRSPGVLVLLPYVDFDGPSLEEEGEDGEMYWTPKAIRLGKEFTSELLILDKLLRQGWTSTPVPDWAEQQDYKLPLEMTIAEEINAISSDITLLTQKRETLEQKLRDETTVKGLLFEKGPALERSIIVALSILGFEAKPLKEANSEFDVVFESAEGRCLGEAEGKDNRSVNIEKLRQLAMNIHEDYERDSVSIMAKGVLFGNAFRLKPPDEREVFFSEKCVTAAKQSQYALVRTTDLFSITQHLLKHQDSGFAEICRLAILQSVGIVEFPKLPEREVSTIPLSIDSADD